MRPEVGFADLVRAIDRLAVTSYEEARAIAELISPGSTLPAPMPSAAPPAPPTPDAPNEREEAPHPEEKEGLESRRARPGRDDRVPPQRLTPSSADHGDAIFKQDLPPRSYQPADASVATPIALEGGAISEPLGILPLIEPKLARAIVSALVGRKEYDGPVDLPAAIATIARRKPLLRIPRHRRPTLRFGAQLLIDVGTGMSPYWLDAAEVERLVCKIVGADRVETARFRGPAAPVEAPAQDAAARRGSPKVRAGDRRRPYAYPAPKTPVLALSDLSFATGGLRPLDEDRWLALTAGLAALGSRLIVLTPGPRDRWPARLAAAATLVQWDRATAYPGRAQGRARLGADEPARQAEASPEQDPTAWSGLTHPHAYALARLVALTARCEPTLLRLLRRTFLPSAEAWIEGELWFSPLTEVRAGAGLILRGGVTQALLDSWDHDPNLPGVVGAIAWAHATAPRLVQLHEQLAASVAHGTAANEGRQHVHHLLAGVAASLAVSPNQPLVDWARYVLQRMPRVLNHHPVAFQLAVAVGREHGALIGSGVYDRALMYSAAVAADPKDRTVAFDLRSRVRSGTRQRNIGVRREQGHAIFEPAAEGSELALSVPDTWPALLDVYTADQAALVAIADQPVSVPWKERPLDVYALDGRGWRLAAGDPMSPAGTAEHEEAGSNDHRGGARPGVAARSSSGRIIAHW